MWKKNKEIYSRNSFDDTYSYLSPSTVIEGSVNSQQDIRIEGTIIGSIDCAGKVIVANSGVVAANVKCDALEISGSLTGDVQVCKLFALQANGCYKGDVLTQEIQIERGAEFLGTCSMTPVYDGQESPRQINKKIGI